MTACPGGWRLGERLCGRMHWSSSSANGTQSGSSISARSPLPPPAGVNPIVSESPLVNVGRSSPGNGAGFLLEETQERRRAEGQGLAPDTRAIPAAPWCRNKCREEFQPLSGSLLSLGLPGVPSQHPDLGLPHSICLLSGVILISSGHQHGPTPAPTWSVPQSPALPRDPIVHAKSLQLCLTL